MTFLDRILMKTFRITKTWRFGRSFDPANKDELHCVDCGLIRKEHASAAHPFREML